MGFSFHTHRLRLLDYRWNSTMSGLLRWVHSSSYLIKFFDIFSFVIIPIIIAVQRLDGPLTSQSVNAQEESKQNGR